MKFIYHHGDRPVAGYRIERPIGFGGFGEVYQATSDGGKEVALKLVQRFLEVELRGVGHCLNLKHQNLITIHDIKESESGERWIIMEFVKGPSLSEVIDRHPDGLPVAEAVRWLEGICNGVGHLHQGAIVHRDLKPSNIFDDDGIIKVGDYGLSKFISNSKRSGQTHSIGTVHYMAPEIGSGRYGREIDVYAIGVIFYEMLTGNVPFPGETPAEVLMRHLTTAPDLSQVPPAFRGILSRMLAKRPEDRYGSPQAVLADLKARMADSELGIEPASFQETGNWQESSPEAANYPWSGASVGFTQNFVPGLRLSRVPMWLVDSLRKHPILCPLCLVLTVEMVVIPISTILAFSEGFDEEFCVVIAILGLIPGVVLSAWGFLLRSMSAKEESRFFSQRRSPTPHQEHQAVAKNQFQPPKVPEPVLPPSPVESVNWGKKRKLSFLGVVGRLIMSIMIGLGIGMIVGGSIVLIDSRSDVAAVFFGIGAGLLACGLTACRLLNVSLFSFWPFFFAFVFCGTGAGLLTAGFVLLVDPRSDEIAAFLGVGVGFFTASLASCFAVWTRRPSRWPRVMAALFCGASVGLFIAGINLLNQSQSEEVGVLLGLGGGFLTCGFAAYQLFFGSIARRLSAAR